MDFKNHIAFRADDSLELVEYLEANGVDYDKGEIVSALDILESDPHWESVSKIIGDDRHYITETVFSKEEMRSAKWLNVRSVWRYDYPQPENKYREITYNGQMCTEGRQSGESDFFLQQIGKTIFYSCPIKPKQ